MNKKIENATVHRYNNLPDIPKGHYLKSVVTPTEGWSPLTAKFVDLFYDYSLDELQDGPMDVCFGIMALDNFYKADIITNYDIQDRAEMVAQLYDFAKSRGFDLEEFIDDVFDQMSFDDPAFHKFLKALKGIQS